MLRPRPQLPVITGIAEIGIPSAPVVAVAASARSLGTFQGRPRKAVVVTVVAVTIEAVEGVEIVPHVTEERDPRVVVERGVDQARTAKIGAEATDLDKVRMTTAVEWQLARSRRHLMFSNTPAGF